MPVEYEAKCLRIDVGLVLAALDRLHATLVEPRRLMRRYVYDIAAGDESQWIRLRDQGDGIVTMTYKRIEHDGVDGTHEAEVEVDSFEDANAFLNAIGFHAKAYQENYRTSYRLDGVAIEVDEWPRLEPYVEVEGPSVEAVHRVARRLGWYPDELTSVNTKRLYADVGIDLDSVPELRF